MPLSCAKALRPTIALLYCTGNEVAADTSLEARVSMVVSMPVQNGSTSLRTSYRHHDLFERGVAGPLADAVDGAFDLPRAGVDAGQRVGHRHAEIVVAVHREARLVGVRHRLAQLRVNSLKYSSGTV